MNQITLAKNIAEQVHAGQFRRDRLTPYFEHVYKVATKLTPFGTNVEIAAAFLHDAVEDGRISFSTLKSSGVSDKVIDLVKILTHHKYEPYESYILHIKENKSATKIKIADILYNLSDDPTPSQIRKYAKALLVLV